MTQLAFNDLSSIRARAHMTRMKNSFHANTRATYTIYIYHHISAATSHICHSNSPNMISDHTHTYTTHCFVSLWIFNCLWKQMVVWAPAELSVKTISILLVLLTRNIFAYFDPPTNENNSPCAGFGSARAPISLNLKKGVWKKQLYQN